MKQIGHETNRTWGKWEMKNEGMRQIEHGANSTWNNYSMGQIGHGTITAWDKQSNASAHNTNVQLTMELVL